MNHPLPVGNAIPLCVRGEALFASCHAEQVSISDAQGQERSRWQWRRDGDWVIAPRAGDHISYEDLLAVLQSILMHAPQVRRIVVDLAPADALAMARNGLLVPQGARFVALAELVWQHAGGWLPQASAQAFPVQQVMSDGRRHPLRPPKPQGLVYTRYIPWLGQRLTLRSLRLEEDLPMFNRWMNDPVVAHFWDETGDLARHRQYLETIAADPHMTSLIASFDDQPFAYFEVYWAKENRIAPFYDCGDFDRGWHVLVGEEAFRGKQFAVAWLTTISHYLLLDDCRTQVVVGEPRADHEKQIRNLDKSGYAKLKEFDFPHKRAMLVMLSRERYFGQGLWQPQTELGAYANPFSSSPL
ncbi:GNAT family N-acetyltransferase [Herbaspirillum sp. alder98]|uniref:GNAT family N-acetyltransferase n=1 Tax=Herbaspirillum sp. alder98 TaxID=2913096 RepID=UPI001CD90207|nr:GNAT family N-acetyltransferase [Herbaspirillum sp. alder98]MCA1323726.1 acetyltransferase [Herbaspirillum sp. alder98]